MIIYFYLRTMRAQDLLFSLCLLCSLSFAILTPYTLTARQTRADTMLNMLKLRWEKT